MDDTDPDITFDQDGVSNWWHQFHAERARFPTSEQRELALKQALAEIRAAGAGRDYDCLIGVSGGVDSSYVLHLARQWSLRPLVLHFDNGWNDELAVANINAMVKSTQFCLQTFVMNWPEFRDLQRAYFRASVIDLEVPTDHMIFGAMHKIASRNGIRHILAGTNFATEWVMPKAWTYSKFDLVNIMAIHRAYGELPMKELPRLGIWQQMYYTEIMKLKTINILDLVPYSKNQAKQILMAEYGWRDYGGKHYESIFTRFYQGYILPRKFGVDKRKAHLSNQILNGEITRQQAIEELARPTDDLARQRVDKKYVAKKLGWSDAEFENILSLPARRHEEYGTDQFQLRLARAMLNPIGTLSRFAMRRLHQT
jgi:N-acetyl sugar amidotransferase